MSEVIKIDSGLRKLEIIRDGVPTTWEYDLVRIKLMCEELQALHGIADSRLPNQAFLEDLAPRLFEGCTVDAAYRICHLVNQQFQLLHQELSEQLKVIR